MSTFGLTFFCQNTHPRSDGQIKPLVPLLRLAKTLIQESDDLKLLVPLSRLAKALIQMWCSN